jgi:hypothetical protein
VKAELAARGIRQGRRGDDEFYHRAELTGDKTKQGKERDGGCTVLKTVGRTRAKQPEEDAAALRFDMPTAACPCAKSGTRRRWPLAASYCMAAVFPKHCSHLTAPFPLPFSHDFPKQHHARL